MPVITAPEQFHENDLYIDLRPSTGIGLNLKVEGLNLAGSIKLKAATEMVDAAERNGAIGPGSVIVESSSGNLGVALSMIAASRGYDFICVTDSRCNLAARQIMESLGATVRIITQPDPVTGYLGARLAFLDRLCAEDSRRVWLNQYTNPENQGAHFRLTAPAIAHRFPEVDVVFVGAGTCGTLMGCARWFREWFPRVHVVAVDSVGSVTFGGPAGRRVVPGLGSGIPSAVLDTSFLSEVVLVEESYTVAMCHRLARAGFLLGGSTGTVVSAAEQWLLRHDRGRELCAVAIAPDLGDRYLDSIYQPSWVEGLFPTLSTSRAAEVATA